MRASVNVSTDEVASKIDEKAYAVWIKALNEDSLQNETAMEAVERWRPTPGLNMIEYIDRGSLRMAEIPQQAALMIEIEGDADLDMTGAPVVVFRHAGSERINVVYRRTDGNIGWVDPPTADH